MMFLSLHFLKITSFFQLNPSTIRIKKADGLRTEFPQNGRFNFEGCSDGDVFMVLGEAFNFPNGSNRYNTSQQIPAIPGPSQNIVIPPQVPDFPPITNNSQLQSTPTFSMARKKALFNVKCAKADLNMSTGKPINILKYNEQKSVPIHCEEEARVTFIRQYLEERIEWDYVTLIQANGLKYRDEEGTRGKNFFIFMNSFKRKFYLI